MTDYRVTDLSLGHPGRATYDPEDHEWRFSHTLTEGVLVTQLIPCKEWIPPLDQIPQGDEKASQTRWLQMRWLYKTLPETVPARAIASNLVREAWEASSQVPNELGSLLAFGRAHDTGRVSGIRRPQIIAVSCGAAGHVLRLIKPRIETRGWGKSRGARISILNPESLDSGYWMGIGGPIRQIITTDGENDKECWLAVRQSTVITLFRPIYGKIHTPPVASTGHSTFGPSLINPNPLLSLPAQTGSQVYADIAFNPWFCRQFAVVDTLGYWSVWEVDVRYNHSKNGPEVLVPKKSGGIYDGQVEDVSSEVPQLGHSDGWYRILWACNLNTVVVCNRRHITAFDIEARTTPLGRVEIFPDGNKDWILDVQRSTTDMNHLYVVTTSRIFWLEIVSARERTDDQIEAGGRVLLSSLHFMSTDDETLKLALLKSEIVSVAITSAKNRLFNYYAFKKPQSQAHASSKGTFGLFMSPDKHGRTLHLHSVNFLPCHLVPSVSHFPGPNPNYIEKGVEFFQLWTITADLGLFSTLTAVASTGCQRLDIIAPGTRIRLSSRPLGPKIVKEDDDFVVPDGQGHSELFHKRNHKHAGYTTAPVLEKDDLRFRVNWRSIFQTVFFDDFWNEEQPIPFPESDHTPAFPELLILAADHIMQRKEVYEPFNITLAEIISATKEGEELEQASPALRTFLKSLEQDQASDDRWKFSIKNLTSGTQVGFLGSGDFTHPDLLKIFDQLVDFWMDSLPIDLPNLARHAKFKVIRQLAKDICFNSIGISLQDRALNSTVPTAPRDDETVAASAPSKDERLTRYSSPSMFSSQLVASQDEPGLTLPTPNLTPSLYSQGTSVSGLVEDSVIARLRQYAPTIEAKPESKTADGAVISHWPSALADPAGYSYQAAKKAWTAANNDEEVHRSSRKEKARRRRRTEEFVKAVQPAVSRRLTLTSGSQPEAIGKMFSSSQLVNEMPATQPDRGTFGSRILPQAKKRQKKQRTAGFK